MGWNGSNGAPAPKQKPTNGARAVSKGAIAGVIVVLGAAAALYFLMPASAPTPKAPAPKEKSNAIAEATAEIAHTLPDFIRDAPIRRSSAGEELIKGVKIPAKPEMKMRELSPEEWDRLTNRTFKTGTEQLLSWVFSTEVGEMPMPIPQISEEDRDNIVGILISKNEIKDTDSDMTAFCKENVELAKREMLAYLKEGGDPDDFLQFYFKELKNAFELRNQAIDQIQEAWDEDPVLAQEFLSRVNERLENEGIKIISKEQFE